MNKCIYCSHEFEMNYNFCPTCDKQIKCLSCGKELIPNKGICHSCGNPVGKNSQQIFNEFSRHEEHSGDSYKLDIQIKASDRAVEKFFVDSGTNGFLSSLREVTSQPENRQALLPPAIQLDESAKEGKSSTEFQEIENNIKNQGAEVASELDEVFPIDDHLEVKVKDFKGQSKTEQQRRFILIYIWGYNKFFKTPVPSRHVLISEAREKKIWGTSFSNIITRLKDDVLIETNEGLKLSPIGDREVIQIIKDIKNIEITGVDYQSLKGNRKTTKKKDENNDVVEIKFLIKKWSSNTIDLQGFDVRALHDSKPRQKIQFGLWILKKFYNEESAPLNAIIEFLANLFPTIGVNATSLRNSATDKKYISRTPKGHCFLTNEGERDIEILLPDQLKGK